MFSHRTVSIIVGVLFIVGTISGILSGLFTGAILDSQDYLAQVSANESQIVTGAFFILLMGISLAIIPVMLFPIFKKYNEALAIGSVVFRGALETVCYIIMTVSWLMLIVLGQEYVKAGIPAGSQFETLGALLKAVNVQINPVMEIVFSLGALMIYAIFFQSQLIPRWLSAWGLFGAVLFLATGLLDLFGPNWEFLLYLLALQEMVMALWLIIKGFNPSAVSPEYAAG